MDNLTEPSQATALPVYNLLPVPPLISGIPDGYLLIALPIITYWTWGGLWYWIDQRNYFPQYRIHTSAEVLKRNRVPLKTILCNVATQQMITTVLGVYLTGEPDQYRGQEYDQSRWISRIRTVQATIPRMGALIGIDAITLAGNIGESLSRAAAFFEYCGNLIALGPQDGALCFWIPRTTDWELWSAGVLYWFLVPAFQFAVAIFVADSWQYFVHRTMHLNPWLYGSFYLPRACCLKIDNQAANFHSIHHRVILQTCNLSGDLNLHVLSYFYLINTNASCYN